MPAGARLRFLNGVSRQAAFAAITTQPINGRPVTLRERESCAMPQAATYAFAYHQLLVAMAGSVCLFGTWVGMRHFARARATSRHHADRLAVHGLRRHRCSAVGLDIDFSPGARPIPQFRFRTGRYRRGSARRDRRLPGRLRDRQPPLHAGPRSRWPRDGRRHPRHAFRRGQGLAHRRPRRMERLWPSS